MPKRPTEDRTQIQGIYTDSWDFDGDITDNPSYIGPNPRLRTSSVSSDRFGRTGKISQKGEVVTGQMVDDVDVNFQYIVRTAETISIISGSGLVSHPGASGAYAQLTVGTTAGSAALLSKAPVRYRGGHEVYGELSWIFGAPEAGVDQYCGFINDNDRWCLGYQGLEFGALFREGGTDTFIPQSEFNLDKLDGTGVSGYDINPQTINVYRLSFVWHGGLPLTIEVQIGQQWWPVHVLNFANDINETHLENPHLPVGGIIERASGSGSAIEMRTGSWRGGSIAAAVSEPSDDWLAHTVLDRTLVSNQRTNIFTLDNPTTWQGKQNHVVYELGVITFDSQANKTCAVYGTKGATLTGADPVQFIDEDNFALQYINGGTVTGGSRGPATVIKAGGERRTDVRGTGIKIYPGESFTVEVDPGGAVNGDFSISARLIHGG